MIRERYTVAITLALFVGALFLLHHALRDVHYHDIVLALRALPTSHILLALACAAPGYTVTNLSLLAPRLLGRLAVSATLYNLFDARYGSTGSEQHLQDVIQQDGRSFRVKTTLHY